MGNGSRSKVVVLSDIHIGDNSATCWYQKRYHEPYLIAALDYIKRNAAAIEEVVLLGDVFDFWTYPCSSPPPSFSKMVEENPNILGPNGKLAEVASVLPNKIVYVNGNHDMNIRQDDIRRLGQIRYCNSPRYIKAYQNYNLLFTHGSEYTMFNALDATTPLAPLPIGHFVTRSVAEYLLKILRPGQTAADLPDNGTPFDYSELLPAIIKALPKFSLAEVLLNYITKVSGIPKSTAVKLLTGQQVTFSQAQNFYANLGTQWINKYGGGEKGILAATKSATADFNGKYIAWFAQLDSLQSNINADMAVLGHTHAPKLGLVEAAINYVNCGFMCSPIINGVPQYPMTFAEIDTNSRQPKMLQAVKNGGAYQVVDFPGASPDAIVYSPNEDFSCYVSILNNRNAELSKQGGETADHGYYVVSPPQSIKAGKRARLWIQDFPGIYGSEGSVSYKNQMTGEIIRFNYACPTLTNNSCGPAPFINKSDSGSWVVDQVVKSGHPYFVNFVYGASIALRASNGRFVCADQNLGGNVPLAANRDAARGWETFKIIDLGANLIALKAMSNGRYVCADQELGSNVPLASNRDAIGPWESFKIIDLGNNQIALKAISNGRYVCADQNLGGNVPLAANRDAIGPWESFTLIVSA